VTLNVFPTGINPFLRHLMENQHAADEAHKAKDHWA